MRPMLPGDECSRRDAIEAAVVSDRRGDVFGLRLKLHGRVKTGDDDPRRDVAEFAGDRLVEQWFIDLFAACPFGLVGSPNNRLVSGDCAGDVNGVDQVVLSRSRTNRRVAGDDSQAAGFKQWRERLLDHGTQRVHQRVHLDQRDVLLLEDLTEHVRRENAGHVAGSEHQTGRRHAMLNGMRRGLGLFVAKSRLQPDVGLEVHEANRIEQITHDGHSPAAVLGLNDATRQRRRNALVESLQVSQHQPQIPHRDDGTGNDLFGSALTVGRDVFDLAGDIDPVVSGLGNRRDAAFD